MLWFSDQILPYDITLAGTTELGAATAMKIFGVEILNEGSGISIDDSVSETQASFVARYVEPWQVIIHDFAILTRSLSSPRPSPPRAPVRRTAPPPVGFRARRITIPQPQPMPKARRRRSPVTF